MQKIEFRNNTQPYINDVNLNQMQDNIEQSIFESDNKIGDLTNLKTTDKTNIVSAVNSLTPVILWHNQTPTSSFAAQQITLNSSDYDMYEVLFYGSYTKADLLSSGRIPKGENAYLQMVYNTGGGVQVRNRNVKYTNATTLNVTDGTLNGVTNNQQNIPAYVIGYKTGLFN